MGQDERPEKPAPDAIESTLVQDEARQARSQERSSVAATPPAVPGHRLVRRLGGGAFGEVWLAIQENTGRQVAIKFFSRHKGLDWPLLKREVGKLLQALTERRIVHLLQVGWDAEPPFYVMEYLPGGTLGDRLDEGPLPVGEAVRMVREVAQALVYLHGKAILHCDLKPSNVLLDDQGQVRLADFGQAQLSSEAGPAAGTLFYMAPELARPHARPDVRSDIYSLGALLYTMLAGHPPYASDEASRDLASSDSTSGRIERYRQIIDEAPPLALRELPGVDPALAVILERCLAREPDRRFENVPQVRARRRRRSQRPLVVLGLAGPLALLAALTAVGGWALRQAESTATAALTRNELLGLRSTARITAAALDYNLEAVQRRVEREAGEPELLRRLLAAQGPGAGRAALQAWLDRLHEAYEDRHFYSWVATDATGLALARAPYDERVVGSNYAYREWFTGVPQTPSKTPGPPRREVGLTLAFESTAAGRPVLVSVGAPVEAEGGAVVGVVTATLHLGTFSEWLGVAEGAAAEAGGCPNRFVALVNRTQLVRHPCPAPGAPALPVPAADFVETEAVRPLLVEGGATDPTYRDPMREGEVFLAASVALERNPGWFALFEEDRREAMRPLSELSQRFQALGWIALAVGLLAVGAVWVVLLRVRRGPAAAAR